MTDRRELREKQLIGELSHHGWRLSPDKRTMRKYTQEEIEQIEASTAGKEVLAQLAERRSVSHPYTCRIGPDEVSEWSLTGEVFPAHRHRLICRHHHTSHVDADGTEHIKYGPLSLSYGPAQPKTLFGRMRKWLRGR